MARRYTDCTMREAYLMGFRGAKENPKWGEYDAATQALTLWPDPPSSAPQGEASSDERAVWQVTNKKEQGACQAQIPGVVLHCWHQADQVQVGYLLQVTMVCCHCGQMYQELRTNPDTELCLPKHGPYAGAKLR